MFGTAPQIELHVSLAGLNRAAGTRALLDWATRSGVRGVRLDATRADVRPRMLDRSARRDLSAAIRRAGLVFGGIDLFVPEEHFVDPSQAERAVDAVAQALELAADMGRLGAGGGTSTVATVLPAGLADRVIGELDAAGARVGATLADCGQPVREAVSCPHVLAGVDPPGVIMSGESPAKLAARLGPSLAHARLSDASSAGRCAVGSPGGKLDVTGYAAALSVVGVSDVTIDLRGLADQNAGLRSAMEAWSQALTLPDL